MRKTIQNLDLTYFRQVIKPTRSNQLPTQIIMGTSEAFAKLKQFLEEQLDMAGQFDTATRTILFRKPWEFDQPFQKKDTEGLLVNNGKMTLRFQDSMKLKLVLSKNELTVIESVSEVELVFGKSQMEMALRVCATRLTDQIHGITFMSGGDPAQIIHCAPLGDWLAIE